MKQFIDEDYLLENETGKRLYQEHASRMPIFDFHCHFLPEQIANNHHFRSITEAWLGADRYGDHYKWRLLREFGMKEEYITGNRSDRERFEEYARVMPYMIGNPISEWTHLELKTYFGITKPLSLKTAKEIYDSCNEKLKTMGAREMMEISHVKMVFTTDDPIDDLHWHEVMAKDPTLKPKVYPAWRPDKAINIERNTFLPWKKKLEDVVHRPLNDLNAFLSALDERLSYFVDHGCSASDHALDVVPFQKGVTYEECDAIYQKALRGEEISFEEQDAYKGYLLVHLGRLYHQYNMVQEYHIGALRDNAKRIYRKSGSDMGYDAVDDRSFAEKLSGLLNELDEKDELPKTILFSINEKDYIVLATLKNCFQGGKKGKIQLGTAWWFNDHYDGMYTQFKKLSADGLLSCFVGMLTDSRSFLSYPRHDYFRRELCSFLGSLVESGRYPDDEKTLGQIVEDISYRNAEAYFRC